MLHKRILIIAGLVMAVLLIAVSVQAAKPVTSKDTVAWKLSGATIVSEGQTIELPADKTTGFPGGILTKGYTIEAKARTSHGNIVPEGTFRLEFSAFKPNKDMPGQKAGLWYIQGNWTIVDKNASKEAKKARHNPYTVEGIMKAALPFNPALEKKNWSALALLPMSLAAGQWAKGEEGVLTLDSEFKGELLLNVQLWSKSR